jgi:hypothetical protein
VLNRKVLTYVQEGVEVPDSLVWEWLSKWQINRPKDPRQ